MRGIGSRLREARVKWQLTLREVEERSSQLSQQWENASYRISASWLDRVEREDRGLSATKLIVLAVIYGLTADQMLALCPTAQREATNKLDQISAPNATLLLTLGILLLVMLRQPDQGLECALGVLALHGEDDHRRFVPCELSRITDRRDIEDQPLTGSLENEPPLLDGREMVASSDQLHAMTGPVQTATDQAADGAGTVDDEAHSSMLPRAEAGDVATRAKLRR